ncbi:hypothetical protein [Mycobacterium lepromatosis]|uniref:hypothetical protein n=1 Tax=Mycobacterium lepromatosis TaxID=480418 RepID=UPI000A55A53B|nr:hypothetical protein [Mycobacterium lepromatosis]
MYWIVIVGNIHNYRRRQAGAGDKPSCTNSRPVIDAAFQVFADKAFGHVRIEDVCTVAG